jgi:hypothetical protein
MISLLTVLSALTTRTSGNSGWTSSPSESVLHTVSVGGMPLEVERTANLDKNLSRASWQRRPDVTPRGSLRRYCNRRQFRRKPPRR